MRAVLATLLALSLVVAVAGPHVHAHASTEGCAVCVLRHADASAAELPELAPAVHEAGEVASAPGLPPVTGAPLGAVPGQSPPAAA